MKQDELERIVYMTKASLEAGAMLVIAPDAILELLDNFRASVELTAIREGQLQEERAEVERLQAIERQVRYYLSSNGDTYQAYLKLCEVCGIPAEEPDEIDEYLGQLETENKRLRAEVSRRNIGA